MSALENTTASSFWKGKRFYIALLLFFNLFINYIDRVNLSIAAPDDRQGFQVGSGGDGPGIFGFFVDLCHLSGADRLAGR